MPQSIANSDFSLSDDDFDMMDDLEPTIPTSQTTTTTTAGTTTKRTSHADKASTTTKCSSSSISTAPAPSTQNPESLGSTNNSACRKYFAQLNAAMQSHIDQFAPFDRPLFHANLSAALPRRQTIADVFVNALPEEVRAVHRCNACMGTLNAFGALCVVDEAQGALVPFLWPDPAVKDTTVPARYRPALVAIRRLFEGAEIGTRDYQITSADKKYLGQSKTTEGSWRHFHFTLAGARVISASDAKGVLDLGSAVVMLERILRDYDVKTVEKARHLLHEKLPHATSHKPVIDWLRTVVGKIDSVDWDTPQRKNLVALYARQAWVGCIPSLRSGVIGELLTMVRDGSAEYSEIRARWTALANPHVHLRPTGGPSIGNIEVAEKTLQELGFTKADLARYWLAADELPGSAILWKDDARWVQDVPKGFGSSGIFDALKSKVQVKQSTTPNHTAAVSSASDGAPPTSISFRNFVHRILPKTVALEIYLNPTERATFFTRGAADSKSPFVFDSVNPANTMCWYYWGEASRVKNMRAVEGWNSVGAISTFPHMWDHLSPSGAVEWDPEAEGKTPWIHARHGVRFLFCLADAKDVSASGRHLCLFPTLLKGALHPVRKTIEAFSQEGRVVWPHSDERKAQVGGLARKKDGWEKTLVRVTTKAGIVVEYEISLFD